MANSCSWEDEPGWELLNKWFQSSAEIAVTVGGMLADRRLAIKRGLIVVLTPERLIVREGKEEHELLLSESEPPQFSEVWSKEIADKNPAVLGTFPDCVTVDVGWETWRFVGPTVIDAGRL
jgi:hypothetical protein